MSPSYAKRYRDELAEHLRVALAEEKRLKADRDRLALENERLRGLLIQIALLDTTPHRSATAKERLEAAVHLASKGFTAAGEREGQ